MPHQLQWLVEGELVLSIYDGDISFEEIQQGVHDLISYLDASDRHTVHNLIDASAIKTSAHSFGDMNRIVKPMKEHPRLGWLAIYGVNTKMLEFIVKMVSHITHVNMRSFDTREEALRFLAKSDPTLNLENIA